MQRSNLSQSTEHLFQPRVFSSFGEALHEDVVTRDLFGLATIIVFGTFDVGEDFEFFAFEIGVVGFKDGVLGVFFTGELDVGEAAGETVCEAFELALLDFSEFGVKFENFFLCDVLG